MSVPSGEWAERYYGQLAGAVIRTVRVEADGTPILVLVGLRGVPGQRLEVGIMADEEGNGPGFIDNLPMPESAAGKGG